MVGRASQADAVRLARRLLPRLARVAFMASVFLMLSGDLPRIGVRPLRRLHIVDVATSPWMYVALIVGSLLLLAATGARGRRIGSAFPVAPLLVLGAAFTVSAMFSQVAALSWVALGGYFGVVAFILLAVSLLDDEPPLAAANVVVVAGALCLAVRVLVWRIDEGLTQPTLNVGNNAWLGKLQVAWVLTLVAPFLLARFMESRGALAASLYGVGWLVLGAAVYVLYSRTASLAFALTTVAMCALNARYWRRFILMLAVVVAGAVIVLAQTGAPSAPRVTAAVRVDRDAGIMMRQKVWRDTLPMIRDHLFVGTGLGTYDDVAYSQYHSTADPHFFRNGWHAHNVFLHVLAETGIIGLAAWCYLWFSILRFLERRWRAGDDAERLHSVATACVVAAFLLLSLTEALIAMRVHASLRMNLTLAFLLVYGCRLASRPSAAA